MKARFDELVDFPSVFSFKVMGLAQDDLMDKIVATVQKHAPGDYQPTSKTSSKGNYYSIAIKVTVTSQEHIETLYKALGDIDAVRHVL